MPERICPPWIGHLLAHPIRKLFQNPVAIVGPYVKPGMTVIEPGPGMGFFTIELARRVGPTGRVVTVDVQEKMLEGLRRRARRAGVAERIDTRLVQPGSLGLGDLAGTADFGLAFAMVHEYRDFSGFFAQMAAALRPGGELLLVEPSGHVDDAHFDAELSAAATAGLDLVARPKVRASISALLVKQAASAQASQGAP